MARSQTLVQLSDELVAALDRHAVAQDRSRSSIIREAISSWLAERDQAAAIEQWVQSYADNPLAEPDEWGDLYAATERHAREVGQRLDAGEATRGLTW